MKNGIPFDGFAHVLEMLRRSDAPFREKILRNLRARDPNLCRRLESALGMNKAQPRQESSSSRAVLEKSQRAAFTRNYGA